VANGASGLSSARKKRRSSIKEALAGRRRATHIFRQRKPSAAVPQWQGGGGTET